MMYSCAYGHRGGSITANLNGLSRIQLHRDDRSPESDDRFGGDDGGAGDVGRRNYADNISRIVRADLDESLNVSLKSFKISDADHPHCRSMRVDRNHQCLVQG